MKVSTRLFVCLAVCIVGAAGLKCLPGDGCTPEAMAELDCPLGFVVSPCRYCECAKGVGEVCGGPWQLKGKCADHLECKREEPHEHADGVCVQPSLKGNAIKLKLRNVDG